MATPSESIVTILKDEYSPEDELYLEQYSGVITDLQQRVRDLLSLEQIQSLEQGDWITVVDGEVVSVGKMHPYRIGIEF